MRGAPKVSLQQTVELRMIAALAIVFFARS